MSTAWLLVYVLLQILFYLLIARWILELVLMLNRSFRPSGGWAVVFETVFTITDPPLKALRRVIPPLRIGPVALDLGFLVLIIAVQILSAQVRPYT